MSNSGHRLSAPKGNPGGRGLRGDEAPSPAGMKLRPGASESLWHGAARGGRHREWHGWDCILRATEEEQGLMRKLFLSDGKGRLQNPCPSRTGTCSLSSAGSKLPQESKVVLVEQTEVVDSKLQHGDAFDSHSEGEARDGLRVIAHHFEHLRVHHA